MTPPPNFSWPCLKREKKEINCKIEDIAIRYPPPHTHTHTPTSGLGFFSRFMKGVFSTPTLKREDEQYVPAKFESYIQLLWCAILPMPLANFAMIFACFFFKTVVNIIFLHPRPYSTIDWFHLHQLHGHSVPGPIGVPVVPSRVGLAWWTHFLISLRNSR